ncbi:MAG: nuclear transport factor 2 family protein [Armatimonadetes bacterium]|nr:nuclear transport factor 2 family protein [Armatimonadota bacterium]
MIDAKPTPIFKEWSLRYTELAFAQAVPKSHKLEKMLAPDFVVVFHDGGKVRRVSRAEFIKLNSKEETDKYENHLRYSISGMSVKGSRASILVKLETQAVQEDGHVLGYATAFWQDTWVKQAAVWKLSKRVNSEKKR